MSRPSHGLSTAAIAFIDRVRELRDAEDKENGHVMNQGSHVLSGHASADPGREHHARNLTGRGVVPEMTNKPQRPAASLGHGDSSEALMDLVVPSPSSPPVRALHGRSRTRNPSPDLAPEAPEDPEQEKDAEEVIDLVDVDDDVDEIEPQEAMPQLFVSQPCNRNQLTPSREALMSFDTDDENDFIAKKTKPALTLPPKPAPVSEAVHVYDDDDDDGDSVAPLAPVTGLKFKKAKPVSSQISKRKGKDQDESSKPKKKRAKVDEERGVPFRKYPSKDVLRRMSRMELRLFLVEKNESEEELQYSILGTNGNIYKCVIAREPQCTCQDFQKRLRTTREGPCKHLIFVFLRVLKLDKEDPKWWQKRLLPSELTEIRDNISAIDGDVYADARVIQKYQQSQEEEEKEGKENECPICFDEFIAAEETVPCRECRKQFHRQCLRNWTNAQQQLRSANPNVPVRKVSCPTCRADISNEDVENNSALYQNFAHCSSQHDRPLSLGELYAETHEFIERRTNRERGSSGRSGRGRGGFYARGRGGRRRELNT